MPCDKRRIGDEYRCARCRTRWDINDPEPPPCGAEMSAPVPPGAGYVTRTDAAGHAHVVRKTTLTDRFRALSKRLRDTAKDVPIPRSIMDDLDDMIEEVKLLDDERQRARANARGGEGANVTPLRRG